MYSVERFYDAPVLPGQDAVSGLRAAHSTASWSTNPAAATVAAAVCKRPPELAAPRFHSDHLFLSLIHI